MSKCQRCEGRGKVGVVPIWWTVPFNERGKPKPEVCYECHGTGQQQTVLPTDNERLKQVNAALLEACRLASNILHDLPNDDDDGDLILACHKCRAAIALATDTPSGEDLPPMDETVYADPFADTEAAPGGPSGEEEGR